MKARELLSIALSLVLAGVSPAQDQGAGSMTIEDLRMTVSRSLVIDYPADISRISTSSPEIVDAVPATTREFLLHGKGIGAATVVVWAKNGQRTMYNITVEHNLEPIRKVLKDTFPNENISVQAGRDAVSLNGTVSSKDVAERAQALTVPLAKAVVNNLGVMTGVSKQVVLKVRFAQMDRNISDQFGVNILSTGIGNTPAAIGTQQFNNARAERIGGAQATDFQISDLLNVFAFRPDLNLAAFVKNLQSQGFLQILAEPNLVTSNGREASFLVGGEFPVPVLQGGGNAGAVTIQFREYGIRLTFTPVITEHNTIRMYVKPEVSTIDLANGVTLSGFVIPALATKRMETNIELGEGQSFIIAGLIDERVQETFNKLPGLANIPVLGALFKSKNESRARSELIVMVTPEITTPLNPGDPKPGPVWLKPFLAPLQPGDEAGLGIIKPTIVKPVEESEKGIKIPGQSTPSGAAAKPKADGARAGAAGAGASASASASTAEAKEDGGPLGRLKFWGKDKDGDAKGKDSTAKKDVKASAPVAPPEAPAAPAQTTAQVQARPVQAAPVSVPARRAVAPGVTSLPAITADPVAGDPPAPDGQKR